MYAVAAVALDAAETAQLNAEIDCRENRQEALVRVNNDIVSLLTCSTPWELSTMYAEVLARLVYLRRALSSNAGKMCDNGNDLLALQVTI